MWHRTHAARIQQRMAGLSLLRLKVTPELAGRSMPAAYALRVACDVVVVGLLLSVEPVHAARPMWPLGVLEGDVRNLLIAKVMLRVGILLC